MIAAGHLSGIEQQAQLGSGAARRCPALTRIDASSVHTIDRQIAVASTLYADEAAGGDVLHDRFLAKRINYQDSYSTDDANTYQAESFFSRIRRAEICIQHHIAGPCLQAYAREMDWREDYRRVSNGQQYLMAIEAALRHPVSRAWKWQRHLAA